MKLPNNDDFDDDDPIGLMIPIGIAGATYTYNFLAGVNGLEAGQGMIILSFLSLIAYITGSSIAVDGGFNRALI